MGDETVAGSPGIRRKLAALAQRPLNFDLAALEHAHGQNGWQVTDRCQVLASEAPGMPLEEGSWEIARRLMRGYEFADPSIVRAYYDPELPPKGRDMLLELKALRVLHLFVGVRVGEVYERTQEVAGRPVCVWGWNYRTLEGHVEMGQMDWEVWKWIQTGEVEFRVHAVSRPAPIANPIIRLGFRLLRGREREAFLQSTCRRMRTLVGVALENRGRHEQVRAAAAEVTARRSSRGDPAHEQLASNLRFPEPRT